MAGSLVQPVKHGDIRLPDIIRILGPLLAERHEGAFHVNPVEPCFSLLAVRLHISLRCPADVKKRLFSQSHGGRHNIRHAYGSLVGCHRTDRRHRSVTEIMSHTAVEMNIRKPRYGKASGCIDLRSVTHLFHVMGKDVSFYINILTQNLPSSV